MKDFFLFRRKKTVFLLLCNRYNVRLASIYLRYDSWYHSLVENNIYLMFSLSFPLDAMQPCIFHFQVRGQLDK